MLTDSALFVSHAIYGFSERQYLGRKLPGSSRPESVIHAAKSATRNRTLVGKRAGGLYLGKL